MKKKEKKETKKHIKKKNNDFIKRVSSRHSFFLIESVHKISRFWTLCFLALFYKKSIHFMFINP
ncbi:hypothetical protein D352_00059 [Enterococcus faecium LA4B-2]|nr:hypothetical protein D352_00059 [Enterococcus faecium LA4B-2]